MKGNRKKHDAATKAKVAIEALKGQRTTNEIAVTYGVHPNLVSKWKNHVIQEPPHGGLAVNHP